MARSVGVSKTTISHALSGKRPVSEKTKAKIEQAVNKLQYYPSYAAQSLVSKKTGIIGMVYPTPLNDSNHRESVEFIFNAANKTNTLGFKFLLLTGDYSQENEQILGIIRGGHIDGVVLMDIRLEDRRIDLLQEEKFPFVMIGRNQNYSELNYVDIDATEAVYEGTKYLAALGHNRILFLGISPQDFGFTYRSLIGYKKALDEAGIPYQKELLVFCPSNEKQACCMMKELVKEIKFTAIVTGGDMIAIGVLETLRTEGIKVPEEISVISVGNSPLCTMTSPQLTALSVRYKEMSELAVEMLIKILNNQTVEENQVLLKSDLVIRQTTGPVYSNR